jgi:Mlc titration factor MtfA (ptsG expression regulator)
MMLAPFFAWLEKVLFWFRDRRRRRILSQPFPGAWISFLQKNVPHYVLLSEEEKSKLRDAVQIFIAEKRWEGCRGLQVTDEMKATIAGQACLLTLGMEKNYFDRVKTILIYPSGFLIPEHARTHGFGIEEEAMPVLGESWYRGPVILAWDEVLEQGQSWRTGANLVLHEFAHQLDMEDGPADGTPSLPNRELYEKWRRIMKSEFKRLLRESSKGRATLLDEYGATNEGEFFAVATECFFEQPVEMRRQHPELYDVLQEYYHQDPAARAGATN